MGVHVPGVNGRAAEYRSALEYGSVEGDLRREQAVIVRKTIFAVALTRARNVMGTQVIRLDDLAQILGIERSA